MDGFGSLVNELTANGPSLARAPASLWRSDNERWNSRQKTGSGICARRVVRDIAIISRRKIPGLAHHRELSTDFWGIERRRCVLRKHETRRDRIHEHVRADRIRH